MSWSASYQFLSLQVVIVRQWRACLHSQWEWASLSSGPRSWEKRLRYSDLVDECNMRSTAQTPHSTAIGDLNLYFRPHRPRPRSFSGKKRAILFNMHRGGFKFKILFKNFLRVARWHEASGNYSRDNHLFLVQLLHRSAACSGSLIRADKSSDLHHNHRISWSSLGTWDNPPRTVNQIEEKVP